MDFIKNYIQDSISVKKKLLENKDLLERMEKAAQIITTAYKNGGKVLLAGNGGSAADAQHIAGELVSKFYFDRPGLSALALTVDTSILTAIGNDYGYERVFARQIEANGKDGDVFIGISTSGNSKNILEALRAAKQKNITTIGLTGENTCQMDVLCDITLKIPSQETPKIQESHIMIGHILCAIVEKNLFGQGK